MTSSPRKGHHMSTSTINPAVSAAEKALAGDATEYRALDKKGKASVRKALRDVMTEALRKADFETAQRYQKASDLLVADNNNTASEPTDYAQVVANRIATLRAAADLLANGTVVPDGFPTGDDAPSINYDSLPVPTVDDDTVSAIATAKITRAVDRKSIQEVIDVAFAELEEGEFLTVQQICHASGHMQPGAVAARLFPVNKDGDPRPTTLTGVVAVEATPDHPKGARKVA